MVVGTAVVVELEVGRFEMGEGGQETLAEGAHAPQEIV